jgi:hypothetical protein
MGEARRKLAAVFGRKPVVKTGVLLAMPTLGGYNRIEQVMIGMLSAGVSARPDVPYLVEPYSIQHRYPVSDARNDCTQHFMEQTSHEYLMFWDHDMIPPTNWFELIGRGDIVSGLTLMWNASSPAHQRIQFNQFQINNRNVSETVLPQHDGKPYEVDVVGTACMAIHRRVFEKLGPRPFKEPIGPGGKRAMGEDMAFCREARAAGFRVTIIPDVVFNHVKEVGLVEVYESMRAYMEIGRKAGYARAIQELREAAAAAGQPEPTFADQVAQAGGAA